RDFAPLFIRNRAGDVAVTDWEFNGWAKYANHAADNAIPRFIAKKLKQRRFEPSLVLKGGSIDVNGAGKLLTTEQCLLSDVQSRARLFFDGWVIGSACRSRVLGLGRLDCMTRQLRAGS